VDGSGAPSQVTKFPTHPVRYLSISADGLMLFSYNGDLYTLREGQEPRKLDITLTKDKTVKDKIRRSVSLGATDIAISSNGKEVMINLSVTNTGKVAGKEVVQIYSTAPQSHLPRPDKELKGFAKTRLLQPGESETLNIVIPRDELKYYNESTHTWQLATGAYTFHVGANVNDIRGKANLTIEN
jgi:hypothetical protein